ncbi:hypothetical protein PROFUN_00254 [Planoprotostelium fungivorum]|uniref:Cytochrome b5 domain-containing protein 1 n=1 Tax=Planoprotostelium fungivorum TaxID=1890364 RepID=A0A2P6NXW2_9EUKA|nr:hypothetical protein PROFUN_00254 [Planoprotostelium fungivorum]
MDGEEIEIEEAPLRRYYTPAEVSIHNHEQDCWASWLGKVYNLTSLIAQFEEVNAVKPLISAAGRDISDWFEPDGELKTMIDSETGLRVPSIEVFANGCVHVPPPYPTSNWRNDFGPPWWKDSTYCIGSLSNKTRMIRVINTLSNQEHVLEVCSEETINEVMARYTKFNKHADQYIWKRLGKPLEMDKTLEENGIADQDVTFDQLDLPHSTYYPALHIYFNNYQVPKT